MRYRITNIVNADVIIEDLSIRLPGKGSSAIMNADVVNRSKDLVINRNLVRVDKIEENSSMPIWPFVKPELDKILEKPAPILESDTTQKDITEIKLMLADILLKMNSKPEPKTIIIEKVNSITRGQDIASETPTQELMFIPSKITPDAAETDIKLREREVSKDDLSRGVQALKRLKSKVK